MAITIEKNQGISLALASAVPTPLHKGREAGGYYKVRSYHGGGEFFQQENAQLILQCLGDFLPRATERAGQDGRMEIFYQHLVSGQDVCSRTAPLNSGVNVPASELKRLEAAIAQLKSKENDPGTDPTKREIIRAFRLPSPQKDPELYRLHGSGSNCRLLVLWGVEKEAGSSLSPQEALSQVPQTKRRIPWWLWLLLVVIILALLGWWWSSQQANRALGIHDSSSTTPFAVRIPADGNDGTGTSPKDSNSPPSAMITLPGENNGPSSTADSRTSASNPQFAENKKGTSGTSSASQPGATGQPPSPGTPGVKSAMTGSPANSPANAGDSPQHSTAGASHDGKPAMTANTPANTKGVQQSPTTNPYLKPSTPAADASGPKGSESPANLPVLTSRRSTTLPEEPKKDAPSTASDPKSILQGPMAAIDQPKGAPKAPPLPLSAEIVNARTGAVPKDGKVEMQLSALARDESGNAITVSKIVSWTLDGKTQLDAAGRAITTNSLPVHLTEGVHRVRITGTTEDGRQITGEADINVDIAIRQESTVRVKQLGKP